MQTLALEMTGGDQNMMLPTTTQTASRRAHCISVAQNKDLYVQGDSAKTFYKIVDGTVAEYRTLMDGRRQIIAVYYAGDVVGMTPTEFYEYSAEAESPTIVECISRNQFATQIEADPDLRSQVMHQFMERLANSRSHIVLLGRMNAIERVASFLLGLHRRQNPNAGEGTTVRIPMSRSDVDDYLGLTIETVSRKFTALRQMKVIELLGPQLVRILDHSELVRLADDEAAFDELTCDA